MAVFEFGLRSSKVLERSYAVMAFLLAMLVQWGAYETLNWLDPWFWPLIAIAAGFLWKLRSFWFIFLFYFLHYNFSFDGPMMGTTRTVVKSPHGDLVFVQERYLDRLFGNDSTGVDEIFSSYRGVGLVVLQEEIFSFGLDGDHWTYYRPRVISGKEPGETVILFCPSHYLTIYPDRTYVSYSAGQSKRGVLHKWSDDKNFGKEQDALSRAISMAGKMQPVSTQNYLHSFILYGLYPLFFICYWCVLKFRDQFVANGWFYLGLWSLILIAYLPFGIPLPVYWPMMLLFLGWLLHRRSVRLGRPQTSCTQVCVT